MATVSTQIQPPDSDGQVPRLEQDGPQNGQAFPGLWLDPAALVSGDTQTLLAALQRGLSAPEHASFVKRLNPPEPRP